MDVQKSLDEGINLTALLRAVMLWLVALIPIAVAAFFACRSRPRRRACAAKWRNGRAVPSHIRKEWPVIAAATLCMLGCGGGSGNGPVVVASDPPVVVASDPQLVAMWGRAQQHLATVNIVLNAAVVKATPSTSPDTVPPDPRALTVGDDGVTVTPIPDLTVAELKAENPAISLRHKRDPTGVIHCPLPTTPTAGRRSFSKGWDTTFRGADG